MFAGRDVLDLNQEKSIVEFVHSVRPTGVINAAAWTAVDGAETDFEAAYRLNALAPQRMAEACKQLDIPFVHVSTDYVFSGESNQAWQESDRVAPLNAYGRTKAAGEELVQATGANAAIIRTSWVFGPTGTNFVLTMARLGQSRDEVRVVSDQIGRPTYVGDLAEACVLMLAKLKAEPRTQGIYHYANAGIASWADVAQAVFDALRDSGKTVANLQPISTADFPTPAPRPKWSVLNTEKIERLGILTPNWRSRISISLGLGE